MSLTCLITSAAAASNHLEIVSSESKYLLPLTSFLYLQRGGGKLFTIRCSAIFTGFNKKKGNLKRTLGFLLMAPEALSFELFGTRAEGKFVLLLFSCALPRVNFTLCSGAANLLFFHEHKILAFFGEGGEGRITKKKPTKQQKAPYVQKRQRLLVTAII